MRLWCEYAKEVRDAYSVCDHVISCARKVKDHNGQKFNQLYASSKAYRLFVQYSSDTEAYKRDYKKAEAILRRGVALSDGVDSEGCECLLKMYIKFGERMLQRVKRDVYDQLSRDGW